MIRLGLTGSIGMGKSTTAAMFAAEDVPVFDADAEVHRAYAAGGAAAPLIEAAFPGVVRDGAVDRDLLGRRVLGQPGEVARLEGIVHPIVGQARADFLHAAEASGHPVVVLDIPLLFETGRAEEVDAVVVVSAPHHVQRERVLARPGMTAERFEHLHARQTPDAEKRARADFVVETDQGLDVARQQVRRILAAVRDPQWKPRAKLVRSDEASH